MKASCFSSAPTNPLVMITKHRKMQNNHDNLDNLSSHKFCKFIVFEANEKKTLNESTDFYVLSYNLIQILFLFRIIYELMRKFSLLPIDLSLWTLPYAYEICSNDVEICFNPANHKKAEFFLSRIELDEFDYGQMYLKSSCMLWPVFEWLNFHHRLFLYRSFIFHNCWASYFVSFMFR